MAKRWYSVSVLSNFEKKIAEQIKQAVEDAGLQEEIGEVLVPTEEVIEVRRGKKVTSERRFMPSYVLVNMEMTNRGYHLISSINRVAAGGEVLVPGDGSDPVQVIDGRDLAEWMVRVAEARRFGTFNAVGPDYMLSTMALMHGIHAVTGGRASFTNVSRDFLDEHKVKSGEDLPIWEPADGQYGGFGSVSNARAIEAGLTFRPLAHTVADLLAWFRSQPAERQATLRAGMSRARESELLAAWHARKA